MWKVYNIQTGRIAKAGFESDDQAKDWLERRKDLADDEFDIDEMDEEEVEELLEEAKDIAEKIIENDPELNTPGNSRLKNFLQSQKGKTVWSKIS